MLYSVITTIQRPTKCVRILATFLGATDGRMVVAGDSKGPDEFPLSGIEGFKDDHLIFMSLEDQIKSEFELARLLPTKHYARKNIGYLKAIQQGASCIYETDDDNGPLESWTPRSEHIVSASKLSASSDHAPAWVNVYKHFSEDNIWPRGLPLDQIHTPVVLAPQSAGSDLVWAPIQQGLADGAPDVDAIWRLVLDREFRFDMRESVVLPPGQWCPFNTQSTWWWPAVHPLLYVPSYCSFRMCDIWKSFVAQRCLWELGAGVVFHAAEVWQERNVHSLIRDFQDEIPGYLQNNRLVQILESVRLKSGKDYVSQNLRQCYQALIAEQIFPEKELALVDAWLEGIASC
jgi:hypothetical protein